ncbi:MAG: LysR family transcriptional regulator [Halioglobus sp.]|nr:LysR family transcriptional regulator [Halioglobus sp.]
MDTRELHKVDLNLLISLHVLLEERSVSRAAERLFITQPAMSKTLSRLRGLFGDALFTRSSHGMQPTPRALEIAEGLDAILGNITTLLGGEDFDPAAFRGGVTIALSEHVGIALLPPLIKRLNEKAPWLNIRIESRLENQLEALSLGNLDFAVQVKHAQYGTDYRVEKLGTSSLAILVRKGHALTRGDSSWQRLLDFPMIKLYVPDREQLEVQRNTSGVVPLVHHPKGVLEISALLSAMAVLRQTNYFMPAPAYLLEQGRASAGLTGVTMPAGGEINIEYALVAHNRTANSPLHNWVWNQITTTVDELRASMQRRRLESTEQVRKSSTS